MSYNSLSNHLMDIVQKLQISTEDRESYTRDAQDIQNEIMERLKKRDPRFKEAFQGLSLTGSYLDDLKLYVPDEFDVHMKLKLPFGLSVEKDSIRPGFVFLRSNRSSNYPIFNGDGYLNRKLLQKWIRENFEFVLKDNCEIQCRTGHIYQLKYTLRGEGCAHTIEATDKRQPSRKISFDFVPAFEFPTSQFPKFENIPSEKGSFWFAVPQGRRPPDDRTFLVCAPHWERIAMYNKQNLKDGLRLMKALKDANNMPHLTSYMLKTVFLNAINEKDDKFWSESMANILLEIFRRLVNNLSQGRLEFFLVPEVNHFDRLNKLEIEANLNTAVHLRSRLQQYNNLGRCAYDDVAKLFNLA